MTGYDGTVRMRVGEVKPIAVTLTAVAGATLTLVAAHVTMYDSSGAVAGGIDGTACTGFDTGALSAPRAWLTLDTSALAAGFYELLFAISATGSDSVTRTYKPELLIEVAAVP